jgi:GT2 family glycosyltransferase
MCAALTASRDDGNAFSVTIPPALRGKWAWLHLSGASSRPTIPVGLRICNRLSDMPISEQYAVALPFGKPRRSRFALIFYPADAAVLHLDVYGIAEDQPAIAVHTAALARPVAALAVALRFPRALLAALRGSPLGLVRRLRTRLALLALQPPRRLAYDLWTEIFDRWTSVDRRLLLTSPRRPFWPGIEVVVFRAAEDDAKLAATLHALQSQWVPSPTAILENPHKLCSFINQSGADYIAILQPGEILPPHALAVLADQAVLLGRPDAITADEDRIDSGGVRSSPHFKPQIGPALLNSGTLTQGIWLFRRATLPPLISQITRYGSADLARLGIALNLRHGRFARVPFVLTHRHVDIIDTPPGSLGDLVQAHVGNAAIDAGAMPIRVRMVWDDATAPRVSIIVPSAARSRHVTRCLMQVLRKTAYPNYELLIVVSQTQPLDSVQNRILAPLLATGRARVCLLDAARFNYARANNHGVAAAGGDVVCLLNDDVAPIEANWLSSMVGHLHDSSVGAVGAKLVYPDGTLQHGGVIIGLAGLAEHANRFLPADHAGYAHRAVLDQDLSCVTGACLLVRRTAYSEVGGMDQTFEIAYNDVDFCLRLRTAGWRIIFSANAVLRHYESASLGHHFAGDRAGLEQVETSRIRARLHAACAADPFHNPNLSLQRGHEWGLAFPPRISKPFAFVNRPGRSFSPARQEDRIRAEPMAPSYLEQSA